MTNIPINAQVECSDGSCGKSTHVIVNPVSHKVTDLVVEDKHFSDSHTRMVPVGKVADVTQDRITLKCTKAEVDQMPPFMVTQYIQESAPGGAYNTNTGLVYTYEYVVNDTGYDEFNVESIPAGELALYRGMHVEASDGKIGRLDELVLDPDKGDITHLLMRKGLLLGHTDISIPVSAVDFSDGDTIYLKLDKAAVKALPSINVKKPS